MSKHIVALEKPQSTEGDKHVNGIQSDKAIINYLQRPLEKTIRSVQVFTE